MISFDYKDKKLNALRDNFNHLLPDALFMSHFDLAMHDESITNSVEEWYTFLQHPSTLVYIGAQMAAIQDVEMRKLLRNVSHHTKSVAYAQIITALQKAKEAGAVSDGPVYIYSYIPLSPDEMQAPNVRMLDGDPFIEEGE